MNLWVITGIIWVVGTFGLFYWIELRNPNSGEADPEEVERYRFKRYMEREVSKAWAGAANADQWAKDLLKAWKEQSK